VKNILFFQLESKMYHEKCPIKPTQVDVKLYTSSFGQHYFIW